MSAVALIAVLGWVKTRASASLRLQQVAAGIALPVPFSYPKWAVGYRSSQYMIRLHFCFCHVERNMSAAFTMQRQIHGNKRYNSTLLYGKLSGPFSRLFLVSLNLSLFGPISVYLILSLGFKPHHFMCWSFLTWFQLATDFHPVNLCFSLYPLLLALYIWLPTPNWTCLCFLHSFIEMFL